MLRTVPSEKTETHNSKHRKAPDYLQVFITFRCNQSCGFCFNRGIDYPEDMKLHDFKTLVDAASRLGVRELDILGGEPTLHPEFMEFMDAISRAGNRATYSTNGTNLSLIKSASETYGTECITPGISINEPPLSDDLHEFIDGYRPRVKTVHARGGALPQEATRYLGTPGIEFSLLYRDAVSEKEMDGTVPFPEFLGDLKLLREKHDNVSGVHCGFLMPAGLGHVRCPAGTTKLSVLPDGSVYPCYLLFRHEEFLLGNILRDDFALIWKKPVLEFFRNFFGSPCRNTACGLFAACHGGCPAMGLLLDGDICAPDPRCRVRQ